MPSPTPKSEALQVYTNASDFFERCSSFLCEREAENNLILGIGGTLGSASSPYQDFFLAAVGTPRVEGAFMMTPPHAMVLSSPASERSMEFVIDELLATGRGISGINGPSDLSEQFARLWISKTGQEARLTMSCLCYKLSSVRELPRTVGMMRLASPADEELLVEWSRAFDTDAGLPTREEALTRKMVRNGISEGHYYLWINERPVSLARASGMTPTGIRISSVYTPSLDRGHGYASSLVAQVSQLKLDEGRQFCFLFTDADNPTSNKIYQRIGYEEVCGFQQYAFASRE